MGDRARIWNSDPEHWQSIWQDERGSDAVRIAPASWSEPDPRTGTPPSAAPWRPRRSRRSSSHTASGCSRRRPGSRALPSTPNGRRSPLRSSSHRPTRRRRRSRPRRAGSPPPPRPRPSRPGSWSATTTRTARRTGRSGSPRSSVRRSSGWVRSHTSTSRAVSAPGPPSCSARGRRALLLRPCDTPLISAATWQRLPRHTADVRTSRPRDIYPSGMETQSGARTPLVDPFGRELEAWLRDAPATRTPYLADLVVPPVTGPVQRPDAVDAAAQETVAQTVAEPEVESAADPSTTGATASVETASADAASVETAPSGDDTAFRRSRHRDRARHVAVCAPSFPSPRSVWRSASRTSPSRCPRRAAARRSSAS